MWSRTRICLSLLCVLHAIISLEPLDLLQRPLAASRTPKPRLLVCIAAHWAPGLTTVHLERVLLEYGVAFASAFDVRIRIDTDSPALRAAIAHSPAAPFFEIIIWSLAELGNPMHLPFMHRHHVQSVASEYDFFIFSEDDVLVPLASFLLYVHRRKELQALGWEFGWVRAEVWTADSVTAISVDNIEPVLDASVWETPSGHLYAEPWSPYAAFYALDTEELGKMITDPSRVWWEGFPPFQIREKVSVGYGYKYTGGAAAPFGARGWRSCALVPLTPAGLVEPDAVIWHLPHKYATRPTLGFHDCGAVRVSDVFNWSSHSISSSPLATFPVDKRGH